jgi:hypothetical protein
MDDRESPGISWKPTVRHRLAVYALPHCPGWGRAEALAAAVRAAGISGLEVRLVDLSQPAQPVPECVVASPTWVLNGRRIAFGNPDPDWLLSWLRVLAGGD